MAVKSSSSQNQENKGRGRVVAEPKKKLKKLKSIRLSRVTSSLRPSARRSWSKFGWASVSLSAADDSVLQELSPTGLSDAASNHTNATTLSDVKGGSAFDNISATSESSTSTATYRNQDRGKGKTEIKKKLRKSRSKKQVIIGGSKPYSAQARSRFDQPSIIVTDDAHSGSSDPSSSYYSPSNSASSGQKPIQTLTRQSMRPSMNEHSELPQDLNVDRATCSSTLKGMEFSKHLELHHGEAEAERTSAMKVCRYHHCSLNGHCHAPAPSLKPFLTRRRRSLKVPKGVKSERQSTSGGKQSSVKKELETSQLFLNVEGKFEKDASPAKATSSIKDEKKMDMYSGVEIHAKPKTPPFRGEYRELKDTDIAEIFFGEQSYPDRSFKQSFEQMRKFELKANNPCCCCGHTKLDESISGGSEVYLQGENVTASDISKEHNISTLRDVDAKSAGLCSPSVSLKLDDQAISNSAADMNVKSETWQHKISTLTEGSVTNHVGNAAESGSDISSIPKEETNEKFLKEGLASSTVGDCEPQGFVIADNLEIYGSGGDANTPKFNKEKHTSMWNLIHQHMILGLAAESGIQPLEGAAQEKGTGDPSTMLSERSSTPDLSNSDMGIQNDVTENQDIELRKFFAIKLVREAFEKILLPEVPDQCSDNQSVTSEIILEQELVKENNGEGEKPSSSTSSDLAKDNLRECVQDRMAENASCEPTELSLSPANNSRPQEGRTATKSRFKSGQQMPSRWSNLKKLILLNRFINELEKVKKFSPRKTRLLAPEKDPETEKVSLRHQKTNEKKNADEWMLDYALRQVVGQLAPNQKKKVALLVKAFETVVPPQEDQHINFKDFVSQSTTADQKAEKIGESNLDNANRSFVSYTSDLCLPPVQSSQMPNNSCFRFDDYEVSSYKPNPPDVQPQQEVLEGSLQTRSSRVLISDVITLSSHGSALGDEIDIPSGVNLPPDEEDAKKALKDAIPAEEKSLQEVEEDTSELLNSGSAASCISPKLDSSADASNSNSGVEFSAAGSTCSLSLDSKPDKQLFAAAREEKIRESVSEHILFHQSLPLYGSAGKTQLDKQKQVRMWHMIYQHVASGIAAKAGRQLLDGADDDNMCPEVSDSCSTEPDVSNGRDDNIHQRMEFSRSDVVKLVQEAVDEILLPDIPDDASDAQSTTSDKITDQELFENRLEVEVGPLSFQEEKRTGVLNMAVTDEKSGSMVTQKPEKQRSKNWSKLKKLLLVKRSILALEKARKTSIKPEQNLPLPSGTEAEKVDLKSQTTDERKIAEQWMLDYAVQHIVTKLTPARKKRVAMLVEAFESVVPLPEL